MMQPEKKGDGPEDNELREAMRRRCELNTYLLVSIGMQSQFQTPTTRRVMEPLPAPNEDRPATVELHQSIRELIFSNPWYEARGNEMIYVYLEQALGSKSIGPALAEPHPEGWQITERGEQVLENKLEQHEHDPDQYPLIPDILDNIQTMHSKTASS